MNKSSVIWVLSFLLWCSHSSLIAQDIPDENVDAIYLIDEGKVDIISIHNMTYSVKKRVKILNKDGLEHAVSYVYYDKDDRKITLFEAAIVDEDGEVLEKLKKSEFQDRSTYDGFGVYQDNRIKIADLRKYDYPFIVEFSYQVEFSNIYLMPDWYFSNGEDTYTIKSEFIVKSHPNLLPRYKLKNGVDEPQEDENGGHTTLRWTRENFSSIENEVLSGTYLSKVPSIILAPNIFVYGGIPGTMNSWKEFGEWISKVNEGRDSLSSQSIMEIKSATSGMDEIEKIKYLYEFLQNKTRYVSIQLGFGGMQPFPAYEVDDTGYGDCKALSNYMYSMLKAVGIKSYYTLVEADDNPRELFDDFVYDPFNHVILSVPVENDTIWLECTSQRIPFGFLGSFTSDREVLIITEDGGKVVRTPKYDSNWNQYSSNTFVTLSSDNSAEIVIKSRFSGLLTERDGLRGVVYDGAEDKKKWFIKTLDQSDISMQSWEIEYATSEIPTINVNANFDIRSVGRKSGSRLFIYPNFFNKSPSKLKVEDERKYNIQIVNSYQEVDTVQIDLGVSFMEKIPTNILIESEFGDYEITYEQDESILTYVRKLKINSGMYDASKYGELVSFINTIYKKDRTRIILKTET